MGTVPGYSIEFVPAEFFGPLFDVFDRSDIRRNHCVAQIAAGLVNRRKSLSLAGNTQSFYAAGVSL